jgi:hypothetical protein
MTNILDMIPRLSGRNTKLKLRSVWPKVLLENENRVYSFDTFKEAGEFLTDNGFRWITGSNGVWTR